MLIPKENKRLQQLIDTHSFGSQNAFAELIGVTQTNINRLFREDARNNEVPNVLRSKSVLKAIKDKFPFADIEWFSKDDDIDTDIKDEGPKSLENKNGNIFVELPNGKFIMTVPLVPAKAYATYISECCEGDFVDRLSEVNFYVDKYARGNYVAFEIKGDSMDNGGINDNPEGSITLCRELNRQHWKDGFRDSKYGWIIVHKDTIVCKDIIRQDLEKGIIICHSRNQSPEYQDFPIELNNVLQIFKVVKRTF
jgi:hypothetical protein